MEKSKAGTWGWVAVGSFVVAWDLLAPETMSSAADRALEHPLGKYAAIAGGLILTAHVLNAFDAYEIPDPIQKGNEFLDKVRDRL